MPTASWLTPSPRYSGSFLKEKPSDLHPWPSCWLIGHGASNWMTAVAQEERGQASLGAGACQRAEQAGLDIVGSGQAVGSWARPHHITAPRERKKPIRQPPGLRLQTTGVRSVRDYKSKAFLLHGSALSASAKSLGLLHYPKKLLICLSTCLFLPATSDQLIKCNLCPQNCPSNKSCKCAWDFTFTNVLEKLYLLWCSPRPLLLQRLKYYLVLKYLKYLFGFTGFKSWTPVSSVSCFF